MFNSRPRFGDLRRSTTSCWRKMRFSVSSRARRANHDRITSSSWVRNATIGRLTTIRPSVRHPDKVFGRHKSKTELIFALFIGKPINFADNTESSSLQTMAYAMSNTCALRSLPACFRRSKNWQNHTNTIWRRPTIVNPICIS